jgi:LytTr DNA-binding domain.
MLVDGRSITFSFNLSTFEKLLESQLETNAQIFVRLGKSFIINMDYIFSIDLVTHQLILSADIKLEPIRLTVSKDALKMLKTAVENKIKNKGGHYE